jgi:hypothetical protein
VLPPLDIGDEAAWQRIEERWAQPLVEALRRGRIGMATLHFDGGDRLWQVEATAADLRRIWRRRRPVAHYFESARAGLDRHRDDGPDEPVRADMERFTRHDVERDAAPGGCR